MFKREVLENAVAVITNAQITTIGHILIDESDFSNHSMYTIEELIPTVPLYRQIPTNNLFAQNNTAGMYSIPLSIINKFSEKGQSGVVYNVPHEHYHANSPLCVLDTEFNGPLDQLKIRFLDKSRPSSNSPDSVHHITIENFVRVVMSKAQHNTAYMQDQSLFDELVNCLSEATKVTKEDAFCLIRGLIGTNPIADGHIYNLINNQITFRIIPTVGIFVGIPQDTLKWLSHNANMARFSNDGEVVQHGYWPNPASIVRPRDFGKSDMLNQRSVMSNAMPTEDYKSPHGNAVGDNWAFSGDSHADKNHSAEGNE